MRSTVPFPRWMVVLLVGLALAGCADAPTPPVARGGAAARLSEEAFIMADGAHLPYRAWLPEGRDPRAEPPWAVVLALHGMNDSRDAWELPAPSFADAGIAVFAPDQRGFGATAQRGQWPGALVLADDAAAMARLLRARYPRAKLILMGESMGAGVLMLAATGERPPPVDGPLADGYVLLAPAVWGRGQMGVITRSALWLATHLFPGLSTTGRAAGRVPSDNREAMIKLSRNPLTIRETRFEAVGGLVDLMDAALASAPQFRAPALVLYGGRDDIIPAHATRAMWRALPADGPRRVFYADGHHWLLRDLGRAAPIDDIIAWIRRPEAILAAAGFLAAPP